MRGESCPARACIEYEPSSTTTMGLAVYFGPQCRAGGGQHDQVQRRHLQEERHGRLHPLENPSALPGAALVCIEDQAGDDQPP